MYFWKRWTFPRNSKKTKMTDAAVKAKQFQEAKEKEKKINKSKAEFDASLTKFTDLRTGIDDLLDNHR